MDSESEPVANSEAVQAGVDAALRFLGVRPRSESEVKTRLRRLELSADQTDAVLERLRTTGLLDDAAFATYWIEQRRTFRPRGERLIRQELRSHGVEASTAADALAEDSADAGEMALRAARPRAGKLCSAGEAEFRRRLSQYLGRRGFEWTIIQETVSGLWSECAEAAERQARPADQDRQ